MNKFQIAVLAGLWAVSPALAGELTADFDGSASRGAGAIIEAAKSVYALEAPQPVRAVAFGKTGNKIIYGADDRLEYYEAPAKYKAVMDASVSLWEGKRVSFDAAAGMYDLKTAPLAEAANLCAGVKFGEQPNGPVASGLLVGADLVLTVGHAIESEADCKNMAFVFGFSVAGPGEGAPVRVSPDNVYRCSEIVAHELSSRTVVMYNGAPVQVPGQDYALIRLDRKAAGRKPVGVNRRGGIKPGDAVFVAGYPMGLPLKYAPGTAGKFAGVDFTFFTVDNLDVFGGNSGSPVVNAETGLVEGVMFGANPNQYVMTPEGCRIYNVLPENTGNGAFVNRLDSFLSDIPLAAE